MSHHYSGPDFEFPHGDARLDLTDLYDGFEIMSFATDSTIPA
jgi:hypothetical protein